MKNITKKERAPRITLEDLALMVKKGFDEVYRVMNKRFDDMDKRFDRLEAKMDNVENTVFKDHAPRIRHIEKKLAIS